MKKIIAAIDGLKYSDATVSHAISISAAAKALLSGVFLEDFTLRGYNLYQVLKEGKESAARIKDLDQKDKKLKERSIELFIAACENQKLSFSLHRDKGIAIQELLHETVYSDLLVIDKKETLTFHDEKPPTRFLKDLLTDIQCPALVVSKKFRPIRKAIFLFDGTPSSVHAIKMFGYLFPFNKIKPVVFSVRNDNSSRVPDENMIKEFMEIHFPGTVFETKRGIGTLEILRRLKKEDANTIVVLGAYRRNRVSRWLKKSLADFLMQDLDLPLFIAHNK